MALSITENKIVDEFISIIGDKFQINYNQTELATDLPPVTKETEQFIQILCHSIKQHESANHLSLDRGKNFGVEEKTAKRVNLTSRPQIGDRVVAMWKSTKWQYFTATICDFDSHKLIYTINWDDNDPTGREIYYKDLAKDIKPDPDTMGPGTQVLFQQGRYGGQNNVEGTGQNRAAGLRWHQGIITKAYKDSQGRNIYDGHHSKGAADGKWITYYAYNYNFIGLTLDDLRMPPNVFDMMNDGQDDDTKSGKDKIAVDDVDIYVSHVNDFPHLVEDITTGLKELKYKLFISKPGRGQHYELQRSLTALNKAKIFIACITTEYSNGEKTLQELQYAKKSLDIPVIPIILSPETQWKASVVGLLIAGQLYIDFSKKSGFAAKFQELKNSCIKHLPLEDVVKQETDVDEIETKPLSKFSANPSLLNSEKVTIFLSYCWSNSHDFMKDKIKGNKFADPREIKLQLEKSLKQKIWLDIEQLSSTDDAGMFGQIAEGLSAANLVVICISSEYSQSKNCEMEAQFALREGLRVWLVDFL